MRLPGVKAAMKEMKVRGGVPQVSNILCGRRIFVGPGTAPEPKQLKQLLAMAVFSLWFDNVWLMFDRPAIYLVL